MAVLERELLAVQLTGQLAGLAHGHEADAEPDGDGRAEDEAARFHPGDLVRPRIAGGRGQVMDARRHALMVADQRGDVAELDARLREIWHRAHQRLELFGREMRP